MYEHSAELSLFGYMHASENVCGNVCSNTQALDKYINNYINFTVWFADAFHGGC